MQYAVQIIGPTTDPSTHVKASAVINAWLRGCELKDLGRDAFIRHHADQLEIPSRRDGLNRALENYAWEPGVTPVQDILQAAEVYQAAGF